jgi:hypothetical protein
MKEKVEEKKCYNEIYWCDAQHAKTSPYIIFFFRLEWLVWYVLFCQLKRPLHKFSKWKGACQCYALLCNGSRD